MADDGGGPLPPGWDRKYDLRTGRYYYINYFNKTTTWEDPRSRYRQLNQVTPQHVPAPTMVENIPMQPPRGVRSFPAFSSYPVVPQSQINSDLQQHRHTVVHFQDMSGMRPSPIPGRVSASVTPARGTPFSSPVRSTHSIMESTLSTDPDVAAAKIGAMFPTVSDTHIRTLLMKYLKSVFPKVEETLLLDILSNSENNVMKATEKLQGMGFEKRDTPPPRLTLRAKSEDGTSSNQTRAAPQPTPPPRMKSLEEKNKMKIRVQDHYKDIPERVIGIALESVDYDEDRALQILQFMIQEEQKSQASSSQQKSTDSKHDVSSVTETDSKLSVEGSAVRSTPRKSVSPARKIAPESSPAHKPLALKISPVSAHSKRPKNKKDVPKMSRGTCTAEDAEYRSPFLTKATGPNPDLHRGANDDLLLADYVTWSGPNPDLLLTPSPRSTLAKGPDPTLLGERTYKPRGPNVDLRKGPLRGLAKGSIYSRLTASAASQVSGESRGK